MTSNRDENSIEDSISVALQSCSDRDMFLQIYHDRFVGLSIPSPELVASVIESCGKWSCIEMGEELFAKAMETMGARECIYSSMIGCFILSNSSSKLMSFIQRHWNNRSVVFSSEILLDSLCTLLEMKSSEISMRVCDELIDELIHRGCIRVNELPILLDILRTNSLSLTIKLLKGCRLNESVNSSFLHILSQEIERFGQLKQWECVVKVFSVLCQCELNGSFTPAVLSHSMNDISQQQQQQQLQQQQQTQEQNEWKVKDGRDATNRNSDQENGDENVVTHSTSPHPSQQRMRLRKRAEDYVVYALSSLMNK